MFERPHSVFPLALWGFSVLAPQTDLVSDILIHGMKARNRSIHGDVVVVELLPKSEWKGRTAALGDSDGDDRAPSEPMPTGEPARRLPGVRGGCCFLSFVREYCNY